MGAKVYTTAYAAYVAFLNLVPGPWKEWEKGEIVDKWSLTHLAWGVAAPLFGVSQGELLALGLLNEGAEALIRKRWPNLTFGTPETIKNISADLVLNHVGASVIQLAKMVVIDAP